MQGTFVSEPLFPLDADFDTKDMAGGSPGLPSRFLWRKQEWTVTETLDSWKEYGDCKHGSGERYLRKHGYRIRTSNGFILKIYFQRSFGKSKPGTASRWWIQSIENTGKTCLP